MQTTTESTVKLTEGAIQEVKRLMNEPDFAADQYLRVGVKGGGCSGMSYILGFDKKEEGYTLNQGDVVTVNFNLSEKVQEIGAVVVTSNAV